MAHAQSGRHLAVDQAAEFQRSCCTYFRSLGKTDTRGEVQEAPVCIVIDGRDCHDYDRYVGMKKQRGATAWGRVVQMGREITVMVFGGAYFAKQLLMMTSAQQLSNSKTFSRA
jgi:hypothetical protein